MSNKTLVQDYFAAVWSDQYDPQKIRELAAFDLLFRYPMHGEFHGPDAVVEMLDDFRQSFPGLNFWAVGDLVEEGEYVVARWEGGGTHTGKEISAIPFGQTVLAETGRKVFFSGTTVLRIEDGRVSEEIGQEGAIDALLQLGVVAEVPASA